VRLVGYLKKKKSITTHGNMNVKLVVYTRFMHIPNTHRIAETGCWYIRQY